MASRNVLYDPIYACRTRSIGGIFRVWAAQRNLLGDWTYAGLYPLQYGQVTGNSVTNVQWWRMSANFKPDAVVTETQELTPARRYEVEFNMNWTRIDAVKRDTFEQMVLVRGVVFIVEDMNRRFWLIGETKGCKIDETGTTDSAGGIGGYALTARAVERSPLREVSAEYVTNYVDTTLPNWTLETAAFLGTLTYDQLLTYVYGQ